MCCCLVCLNCLLFSYQDALSMTFFSWLIFLPIQEVSWVNSTCEALSWIWLVSCVDYIKDTLLIATILLVCSTFLLLYFARACHLWRIDDNLLTNFYFLVLPNESLCCLVCHNCLLLSHLYALSMKFLFWLVFLPVQEVF